MGSDSNYCLHVVSAMSGLPPDSGRIAASQRTDAMGHSDCLTQSSTEWIDREKVTQLYPPTSTMRLAAVGPTAKWSPELGSQLFEPDKLERRCGHSVYASKDILHVIRCDEVLYSLDV
jgi:hypothetical protein